MQRVLIVGCPGAGKSTAARRLAGLTGLPVIHLDQHYWLPGWVRPEPRAWRERVQALAAGPRWIMDGNYGGTLGLRLMRADTVVHLDFSTPVCLTRVLGRTTFGIGGNRRGELPEGCLERPDLAFVGFVLNYRRTHRRRDLAAMAGFSGTMRRFEAPGQLERFFASLAEAGRGGG